MKKLTNLMLSATALLLATSCTKDLGGVDSAAIEQQKKDAYAANFVKRYGPISPEQTWDFTQGSSLGTTRAEAQPVAYLCDGLDFNLEEHNILGYKYTVRKNTSIYNTIKTQLPDGRQHTGKKEVMVSPGTPFAIYPVTAQGAWKHKLYVKVGDTTYKLYDKTWTVCDRPVCNGMQVGWSGPITPVRAHMYGIFVDAPVGTPIEIYLDDVNGKKGAVGTCTGNAIVVDAGDAKPEVSGELQNYTDVKYIGIEDNINGGDRDYNDVVLAMVGYPSVPQELKIEEDEYTLSTTLSKRYMVEDLGDTDDFDFNDIVIDVYENTTSTHKVTLTNGTITKDEEISNTKKQKAVVRHRGGIYPFTLTIGNITFDEMQGVLSDDPNIKLTITDNSWDPETNNVSLKVRETPTNNVVTIPFGMQGKAPMMVAVEPTRAWMAERKAVPNNWFSIAPDRLKNRPDQAEVEEQETPETELPVATDEE